MASIWVYCRIVRGEREARCPEVACVWMAGALALPDLAVSSIKAALCGAAGPALVPGSAAGVRPARAGLHSACP